MTPDITVRTFQPGDEHAFRALNEEWIAKFFRMEEKDRETLGDPERFILGKGGYILMAERGGQPVGCCALMALPGDGAEGFEVAKMAVAESERGRGIGRQILDHVIAFARERGIRRLYLETNTKLENAVRLYEAVGFRPVPAERVKASPYARANVFMEMNLAVAQFFEK